jgi:hypothetical protein
MISSNQLTREAYAPIKWAEFYANTERTRNHEEKINENEVYLRCRRCMRNVGLRERVRGHWYRY